MTYFASCLKNSKKDTNMSRICQITGKTSQVGNNVSHSRRRTKRTFEVNLFNKKLFLQEENRWVNLRVSAAGLRVINKVGLKKALESAKSKGFIKSY
jgi:large subunit ribosomal protein L28